MVKLNDFVHLKVHSEYSIIDSIIKINDLILSAKKNNMYSLSISDFSNFFGLIKFYEKCCLNNIKPIIGIDVFVDNEDKYGFTINTLIAMNNIGYNNLIYIISISSINKIDNNYKFPIISKKLLINNNKGIIILSGGLYGYIGKSIINHDNNSIIDYINLYAKIFKDRFYLEISRLGDINENYYIYKSINISKKFDIPLIATNNVVFLEKDDFNIHSIKIQINKKNFSNINISYKNNQYFKSKEEMFELFNDIPESIINTIEVSKRCNVYINTDNKTKFIKLYGNNKEYKEELINISKKGLKKIIEKNNFNDENIKIYSDRLNKELKIINNTGFTKYFLIVKEFIDWSKKNNIPVGPGRGSGAGSLVAFALNITEIDPIKFNLIFERFLNPHRISMPDLDIDFCVKKRDLVINHVIEKYGNNKVSKIITFNTMTSKSVIKDVGRVLGFPYTFVDKISKLIPTTLNINLKEVLKINDILFMYNNDEDVKILIDISLKIEGIIKNIGKHAGGVVISNNDIIKSIPIHYNINDNYSITQFDKNDIEKIGLIKFDFLGLKTLSIINDTLQLIKQNYNKDIDINDIKLDDKNSFIMLNNLYTNGIFQLESYGIKKIIKKIKPSNFEDIISIIALFRPGPIKSGMVEKFINRKNKTEKIYYPSKNFEHNILKNILKNTYGIILYQEQIIEIAQKLSKFSLSEADIFRIAISKKKLEDIKKQKKKFIIGAKENGINYNLSKNIFYIIEKFSNYGFNKSHSTAYALIAYRTLWLKSNYKEEFITSVINNYINNTKKVFNLIEECKKLNIKINEININHSKYYFCVNKKKEIEFGLGLIKGISKTSILEIIKNREEKGFFKDIIDFSIRLNLSKIGKKNLEILFENNFFKKFNLYKDNKDYKYLIKKYIKISEKNFLIKNSKQIDIFGLCKFYK